MPSLGLGLGLHLGGYVPPSIIKQLKDAGAVLALLSTKADGRAPLTGDDNPWVDLANSVGKNLSNGFRYAGFINASGAWVIDNSTSSTIVPVKEGEIYTQQNVGGNRSNWAFFSEFPTVNLQTSLSFGLIETTTGIAPVGAKYLVFYLNNTPTLPDDVQVELGPTATAYEPYAKNNGTLTNFAGTASSGWNTDGGQPLLTFDGVDDYVQFADTASLDITTAPVYYGFTFAKTDLNIGYLYQDTLNHYPSARVEANGDFKFRVNTVDLTVVSGVTQFHYVNFGLHVKSNTLADVYKDGLLVLSNVTVQDATTWVHGIKNLGATVSNGININANIATHTIYTGSDINKILDVEAKISAPYLALNP